MAAFSPPKLRDDGVRGPVLLGAGGELDGPEPLEVLSDGGGQERERLLERLVEVDGRELGEVDRLLPVFFRLRGSLALDA